jgi:hypothetical protein
MVSGGAFGAAVAVAVSLIIRPAGVRFRDFSVGLFAHILPGLKFTVQCRPVRVTRNVPAKGEASK